MLLEIFFLNVQLNKSNILQDGIHTLFAKNKAKHILYRHISYSYTCSDTIYSKSIKKTKKSFLKVNFFISHFLNIKTFISHVSIARNIYFNIK